MKRGGHDGEGGERRDCVERGGGHDGEGVRGGTVWKGEGMMEKG